MRVDSEQLRECIGRSERASEVVDAASAERMAALLDWQRAPRIGDELPAAWHWMFTSTIVRSAELGADGHPARGLLPHVDGARRMWGGSRVRIHSTIRIGDALERTTTIHDARERQGRSGSLIVVTLHHALAVDGVLAVEEEQDVLLRDAGEAADDKRAPADATAHISRSVVADPVMLFRYSAVTFNAHRIHYDRDYATRVEGYPGLLVQGPLTATLLLDLLARERPFWRPRRIAVRARGALFDGAPIGLHGRVAESLAQLWATGPDGGVALTLDVEGRDDA